MKKLTLFLILLFPVLLSAQNKFHELFQNLDVSKLETGILYNQFFSFANLTGDLTDPFNASTFVQAYNELAAADMLQRFGDDVIFKDAVNQSFFDKVIPIGIIYSEFEIIKEQAVEDGYFSSSGLKINIATSDYSNVFDVESKLIASPLRDALKGKMQVFEIRDELSFNTTDKDFSQLRIDFGDGTGFRPVSKGDLISIMYNEVGTKSITYELTLNDGQIVKAHSRILIKDKPLSTRIPGIIL